MLPDRSEIGEFMLWVFSPFREVIAVLVLVVQALVLVVFTIEDFGVPRRAAIAGLALFPVVCFLMVRCSTKGTGPVTFLTLNSAQQLDQESREPVAPRSPIAPSAKIPCVIEERRRPSNTMFG